MVDLTIRRTLDDNVPDGGLAKGLFRKLNSPLLGRCAKKALEELFDKTSHCEADPDKKQ